VHPEAYNFVKSFTDGKTFTNVLEFGSLNINGSVRDLVVCENYWGIDLQEGPGVDEVADAVSFRTGPQDLVLCCEVLEHAPDVAGIIESAYDNLRYGGHFVITCATYPRLAHSALDGGPLRSYEHYKNVDPGLLDHLLEQHGFENIEQQVHRNRGDLYVIEQKS
jgi:SAM-dependent methyltransferase